MSKKKIYIAGRVKGLPIDQVEQMFAKRQQELEAQGFEVINPVAKISQLNKMLAISKNAILSDHDPEDRKAILKFCLQWMLEADEIDLLFNWKESEFAQKERNIALEVGMSVNYPK